jgi:uncharacterized protein YdhG (YjbR/CyaY superfamily)
MQSVVDEVRAIVRGADPSIEEGIKWNAPSFRTGEWFATINARPDAVFLILHLGSKVKDGATGGLAIDDPAGLLEWLSKDRAAVRFKDVASVRARRRELVEIVRQWIGHVGRAAGPAGPIDAYLARVKPEQRAALEKLRSTIRAAAPGAEECLSYGLCAFKLGGRPLVAFGATPKHCAFYPMNGTSVAAHAKELARFETSKGTIRFQPGQPLPASLVRKLVKERVKESRG